jgi:hypothetical protein
MRPLDNRTPKLVADDTPPWKIPAHDPSPAPIYLKHPPAAKFGSSSPRPHNLFVGSVPQQEMPALHLTDTWAVATVTWVGRVNKNEG